MTNLTAEELLEMEKQDAIEREKMFDWMKSIGWKQEEQDGRTFWRGPNGCAYGDDEAIRLAHEWFLRDKGWTKTIKVLIVNPKFMHHDYFRLPSNKVIFKYFIHPGNQRLYLEGDALAIAKCEPESLMNDDRIGKSLNKIFGGECLGPVDHDDIVYLLRDLVSENYVLLKLIRNRWMRDVQMAPYWEKAYNEQKETNSQKLS